MRATPACASTLYSTRYKALLGIVAIASMMAWKHFHLLSAIVLLQIYLIAPMCYAAVSCRPDAETVFLTNHSRSGLNVVERVISKLHSLQILKCDHRLLRRIALAETEYGTTRKAGGGIWALNESQFQNVTKEVDKALSELCLSTPSGTPYNFLNKPLVSGLAASLYINYWVNNRSVEIPLARNIEKQAQFWKDYYHSGNLTVDHFVEQVENKDCDCSCFRGKALLQEDLTPQDGANGSDVVEMVLAKISWMPEFSSDHRLLRRITYVETDDGTSSEREGGIWAVDEWKLSVMLTAPELVELRVKIDQELDIGLECSSLSKPLVSGLAARLYLHYLEIVKYATIPSAVAIEQQAQYWHKYYYSGEELTAEDFEERVTELENEEGQYNMHA